MDQPSYEMIDYAWFQTTRFNEKLPYPYYVGRGVAFNPKYDSRLNKQAPLEGFIVLKLALSEGSCVGLGERMVRLPSGKGVLRYHGQNHEVWDGYHPRHRGRLDFLGVLFKGTAAAALMDAYVTDHGHIVTLDPNSLIVQRLLSLARSPGHTISMSPVDGFRLIADLFAELYQNTEDPAEAAQHRDLAHAAERIMKDRVHEAMTVERLAADLDVSREHLARVFRRQFGLPPQKYFMQLRVREACTRLRDSNDSIKTITRALGFESRLTFIRTFRRVIGMTPSEYRKGQRRML